MWAAVVDGMKCLSLFLRAVGHKKAVEKLSRRTKREQGPGLAAVLQAGKGREGLPWSWVMWRLLHPKGVLAEFMPLAHLTLAPAGRKGRGGGGKWRRGGWNSLAWPATGKEPSPTRGKKSGLVGEEEAQLSQWGNVGLSPVWEGWRNEVWLSSGMGRGPAQPGLREG